MSNPVDGGERAGSSGISRNQGLFVFGGLVLLFVVGLARPFVWGGDEPSGLPRWLVETLGTGRKLTFLLTWAACEVPFAIALKLALRWFDAKTT